MEFKATSIQKNPKTAGSLCHRFKGRLTLLRAYRHNAGLLTHSSNNPHLSPFFSWQVTFKYDNKMGNCDLPPKQGIVFEPM